MEYQTPDLCVQHTPVANCQNGRHTRLYFKGPMCNFLFSICLNLLNWQYALNKANYDNIIESEKKVHFKWMLLSEIDIWVTQPCIDKRQCQIELRNLLLEDPFVRVEY